MNTVIKDRISPSIITTINTRSCRLNNTLFKIDQLQRCYVFYSFPVSQVFREGIAPLNRQDRLAVGADGQLSLKTDYFESPSFQSLACFGIADLPFHLMPTNSRDEVVGSILVYKQNSQWGIFTPLIVLAHAVFVACRYSQSSLSNFINSKTE